MANLEDYNIFVRYYKFFKYMLDKIDKFPRVSKFTIGDRITNLLCDIQENIIEAIYTKNRYDILKNTNLKLEKLRIYIRISLERSYISIKQSEYIFNEINDIGKMLGGWINTCKE